MLKYFYCDRCNEILTSKVNIMIDSTDPTVFCKHSWFMKCNKCGSDIEEIDRGMAIPVLNLNKVGLKIDNSCEGHFVIDTKINTVYEYHIPYILFNISVEHNDLNDIINKHPLPEGWDINADDDNRLRIFYTGADYISDISLTESIELKEQYLYEICMWTYRVLEGSDLIE